MSKPAWILSSNSAWLGSKSSKPPSTRSMLLSSVDIPPTSDTVKYHRELTVTIVADDGTLPIGVAVAEPLEQNLLAMLRLAKDLNAVLTSDMQSEDIQKQARFLAETSVYPQLHDLAVLNDPGKPWYKRVVDLAKAAPELATNFATMPSGFAFAKLLGKIANTLADARDEQLDKEGRLVRSGIYYLFQSTTNVITPRSPWATMPKRSLGGC